MPFRLLPVLIFCAAALLADVRLPSLFSDHMLLQGGVPVRVWGKGEPGEQVTVRFRSQSVSASAGSSGQWEAFLAPLDPGGPSELTVEGKNTITIRDVLVGDVWVASGQSNMVWPVRRSNNPEQEIAAADYPQIRLFKVAMKVSPTPLDDVSGSWMVCGPQTVGDFSGVGYFFARHLNRQLKRPVGVIQSAWGGTPAESWTSGPALASDPGLISVFADWAKLMGDYPSAYARYRRQVQALEAKGASTGVRPPNPPVGPDHQWSPAGLYNAMISPLTPYAIKGAIWYQGENNASKRRSYVYRRLFQTLIQDWRQAWGQGAFPFLFVQLANYARTGEHSEWPELREAQAMALDLNNTGMAVTIDIGNPTDIHPTNKQDVGLRLALAARAIAYGEKIVYSGPLFRQATREPGALRIWFDHAGGGLMAEGGDLKGFTIAGPDGEFVAATAAIEKTSARVSSPQVRDPVAVRYAWADSPECNLYNAEGLPAAPFRSDEWTAPRMHR
jgi:sialate O-acetylesterase